MSTVQAPQWLVSQPMCAPVNWQSSRRKWMSRVRGSTAFSTARPFNLTVMSFLPMRVSPFSLSLAAGGCLADRALDHLAGHGGLVFAVTAQVLGRIADRHRLGGSVDHRCVRQRLAEKRRLGIACAQCGRRHVRERNAHRADLATVHSHHDSRAGGGPVTRLALELFVGVTSFRGESRHADLGEDFIFGHVGHVGAEEEAVGLDHALTLGPFEHQGGVQRNGNRRMVVARVAVGDVAADGAAIAHLRVCDQSGRLGQDRQPGLENLR
mmetsp:Transcript_25819/g.46880  ORF Transcript_25819/g.46880 Transcript_25819/m.46880 type:complete len:267 (+) Transcript_25819:950-1750(+)